MGMLDRELRQVRTTVIPNVKRETLQAEILNQVHYGGKRPVRLSITHKLSTDDRSQFDVR